MTRKWVLIKVSHSKIVVYDDKFVKSVECDRNLGYRVQNDSFLKIIFKSSKIVAGSGYWEKKLQDLDFEHNMCGKAEFENLIVNRPWMMAYFELFYH